MKTLLCLFVIGACCAFVANGFLFSSKFKNGCDPNPCKNKATCKLDAKNQNVSTCVCTEGFFGPKCDQKSGCAKKPCRKGTCIENKLNPANYTCKCNAGFVGPKCDIADGCAKTPCKNGKCALNQKLKPECTCLAGWSSKNCDKRNCTIAEFKGKHLTKMTRKVYVDQAIYKKMEDLDSLAKLCNVKLHIEKSFMLHPDPKQANSIDIKDKTNPGHYIGQAVSLHVYDNDDKLVCNDICLGKLPIPHPGAKCLVDGLHAINWKWSILHPTEVSTNYHLGNTVGYNALREHHQVGCREKKF